MTPRMPLLPVNGTTRTLLTPTRLIYSVKTGIVTASSCFPDGVIEAARYGVRSVIQPGGSIRDQDVIEAANARDIAMVFSGIRHFKH